MTASLAERQLLITELLREAPLDLLRRPSCVAGLICRAGLQAMAGLDYGADNAWAGEHGMLQMPCQLAPCLVELSRYPLRTYLEIGTYNGVATTFLVAYLRRFNPRLRAVTVDCERSFLEYEAVARLLPLHYHIGTSDDFRGQVFDLCFIDGDHEPAWVERDYENVGRASPLSLFHDINCRHVAEGFNDGPRKCWERLKRDEPHAEFREYLDHSDGLNVMGLGLRIRHRMAAWNQSPRSHIG
jgi:hypothetical protein